MNDLLLTVSEISVLLNPKIPASQRPKITSAKDAYSVFLEVLDNSLFNIKEEAAVLFLNRANRVVGAYKVSSGGITGTVVDIRLILGIALKTLACGLIIAHTHPSGELNASIADITLTSNLKKSAELMDIRLLDHLIISSNAFESFADQGLI